MAFVFLSRNRIAMQSSYKISTHAWKFVAFLSCKKKKTIYVAHGCTSGVYLTGFHTGKVFILRVAVGRVYISLGSIPEKFSSYV